MELTPGPMQHEGVRDATPLTTILERLARNVQSLLGVTFVSIALLDAETGDVVTQVARGAARGRQERFRPNEGIEGWVAAHLEPIMLADLDAQKSRLAAGIEGIRSLLCIPLIDGDTLLGTLLVGSPHPHAFDMPHQELLELFTDQAVLAVNRTLQSAANEKQARELTALLESSRALTSSLDRSHVFAYVVGSIRKVVACEEVVIYIHDEPAHELRIAAGMGTRMSRLSGTRIALDDPRSIAAWVAQERRARLANAGAGEMGQVTELLLAGAEMALLCVPLISKDRLRGVIMLARTAPFSATELHTMLNLSNIIAATLENVALYQRVRDEHAQQAAMFAAASDGIVLVDDRLHILEANDAFARLVHLPRTEAQGRHVCDVLRTGDMQTCALCPSRDECLIRHVLDTGEPVEHAATVFARTDPQRTATTHTSGGPIARRYVDFAVTPIAGGSRSRVLLVGRDVTAQREADETKSNFLAMISHELRSPLQIVNGYLDLVLGGMGGVLSDEQEAFLRKARSGSEHLTGLVNDLLLLSRRDAGKFSLTRQDTDLAPTVRDVVEEMEVIANDAEVRLVLDVPAHLPSVSADAPRIGQVIRNLITNAIKFTAPGGEVTVSAAVEADQVVISVHDTGVGMSPEHLQRIFERYYQIPSQPRPSRPGRHGGQGLGLAIVRIIMDGHGGTIGVASIPNEGSTFTLRLPCSEDITVRRPVLRQVEE